MASAVRCRTRRSCATTRRARVRGADAATQSQAVPRRAQHPARCGCCRTPCRKHIRHFALSCYAPTSSFAAWLTRIAINEALMLRRRLKRPTLSLDEIDSRAEGGPMQASSRLRRRVARSDSSERRAFGRCSTSARPPAAGLSHRFVLREVEQLSIAETADCLGLNAATVKTRLHRARAKLRAVLTRRLRREQLQLFDFGGERCDRIVAAVLTRLSAGAASRSIAFAGLLAGAFAASLMCGAPMAYGAERISDPADSQSDLSALEEIRKGREIFRRATFGDEDFWGGTLGLHEAIAGAAEWRRRPGAEPEGRACRSDSRSIRPPCRERSSVRCASGNAGSQRSSRDARTAATRRGGGPDRIFR